MKVVLEGAEELERKMVEIGARFEKVLAEAAEAGGEVLLRAANENAPGPLAMQLLKKEAGRAVVGIGPKREKWFYRFFETGAAAHEIAPTLRKALFFQGVEGEVFLRRAVTVPGTPAQPFLRPALDSRKDEAVKAVWERLRESMRDLLAGGDR